jgi:hypothetical protein
LAEPVLRFAPTKAALTPWKDADPDIPKNDAQITMGRITSLGALALIFRRLVARDLARPEIAAQVDRIFDLGSSGGSDIASQKDSMIAEAFQFTRRKLRRR